MVTISRPPVYKTDYLHQIPSSQLDTFCWRRSAHFNTLHLHWCPTEQPRLTVTSFRCYIWWKRGCVAIATTLNCPRRAMHVGFSIATIWPIAMTHASSFGRPVSQKRGIRSKLVKGYRNCDILFASMKVQNTRSTHFNFGDPFRGYCKNIWISHIS